MEIDLPLVDKQIELLKAGDLVHLNGWIYTARDAAHKRMMEDKLQGNILPFDVERQTIYYAGPAPTPPGKVIGSIGPTTSSRMDPFTTFMLNQGVKGFIGKGPRSTEIRRALQQHGAVYFAAIGGAAALQARSIIKMETIAYEDLGAEAIRRLYVSGMAVYVANDCYGGSIFPEEYDYKE